MSPAGNPELVSRERHQSQFARPFVVVNARVVCHVVGEKPVLLVRCDAADLVTAERHAAVAFAVRVGVAAGTRQQMQAPVTVPADVRPFLHLGMDAVPFAQISGPYQPDAAEIGVEEADDAVGDHLEFALERGRRKKRLLEQADALLPQERSPPFLLRPLALGDVPEDAHQVSFPR